MGSSIEKKIAHIFPEAVNGRNTVTEYSLVLNRALSSHLPCKAYSRPIFNSSDSDSLINDFQIERYTDVLLEYTPNLYGWRSLFPLYLVRYLKRCGIHTCILFHEIFLPDYFTIQGEWLVRPYNYFKDLALLHLADFPVVTFRYRAERLWERYKIYPTIIPVFSPVPSFTSASPEKAFRLGAMDTGHPDSNTSVVVKAAALLETDALIIGRENAGMTAAHSVYTGVLPADEVSKYLVRMGCFVLSDRRGISFRKSSVATALMNAVPVVANATAWTDPEFRHGENVFFHDGSAEGIAEAIKTLEANPGLSLRIGQAGRKLYEARMTPESAAKTLVELISGAKSCA